MSDDVLTRDNDGNLAVRTVSSTGDNYVNPDDVYTRDSEGKLCIRTTGQGGGGGGDQHNLGWYATQAALEEAYPTATAGDWAIVGATDTVWIWDTDTSAWKDSDQKGQVTSVNGKTGAAVLNASDVGAVPQYSTIPTATAEMAGNIVQFTGTTGANYTNGYFYKCVSDGQDPATYSWTQTDVQPAPVIPDPLPSQTGNAGKFLITNGTEASWSTSITQNLTLFEDGVYQSPYVYITGNTSTGTTPNFGVRFYSNTLGELIFQSYNGNSTTVYSHCFTPDTANGTATLGKATNQYTRWDNVYTAKINAGNGSADIIIPTTGGTMAVVNTPSTMPTLAVADWSNNTQTVNVTGVTATNTVFVSPAPASAADYASAGIVCTAQGAGTLTFTCTTTPTNAITVNVVCL